jgi:hypothetical protein
MRLRSLDTRPPQHVRVTLDGATHDKLTAYIAYASTHGQHFEDVRQLLTEIARAFVDGGDKGFTAWYRARQPPAAVPSSTGNGGQLARPVRFSEQTSTPIPGAKGEAEEGAHGSRRPDRETKSVASQLGGSQGQTASGTGNGES